MIRKLILASILLFCTHINNAHAGWLDNLKGVVNPFQAKSLSDSKIGQGLKEALSIGIDKAVAAASREGGFYQNKTIKIKFPEQLSLIETAMRKIGMGAKIDNFEKNVNYAAEKAAPQAKEILLDALFEMSIEDARKLLSGGETAATDYFRLKSWDRLHDAFLPYLKNSMDQYGALQSYNQLIAAYEKIPFASKPEGLRSEEYATQKALEGLFYLVAEQEKEIRTNPQARVTKLLQSVFKGGSKA